MAGEPVMVCPDDEEAEGISGFVEKDSCLGGGAGWPVQIAAPVPYCQPLYARSFIGFGGGLS